jgi:hypothetical protein
MCSAPLKRSPTSASIPAACTLTAHPVALNYFTTPFNSYANLILIHFFLYVNLVGQGATHHFWASVPDLQNWVSLTSLIHILYCSCTAQLIRVCYTSTIHTETFTRLILENSQPFFLTSKSCSLIPPSLHPPPPPSAPLQTLHFYIPTYF